MLEGQRGGRVSLSVRRCRGGKVTESFSHIYQLFYTDRTKTSMSVSRGGGAM